MKRKFAIPQVLRGILALLCLAGILAYALWPRLSGKEASSSWSAAATGTPSSAEAEATPSFGDTIRTLLSEISAQEKTDALILSELHTGTYTAEEPLVLDNPYGCSPLTALAVFTTEEPTRVSIRVHGKTNDAPMGRVGPRESCRGGWRAPTIAAPLRIPPRLPPDVISAQRCPLAQRQRFARSTSGGRRGGGAVVPTIIVARQPPLHAHRRPS